VLPAFAEPSRAGTHGGESSASWSAKSSARSARWTTGESIEKSSRNVGTGGRRGRRRGRRRTVRRLHDAETAAPFVRRDQSVGGHSQHAGQKPEEIGRAHV